MKTTKLSDLSVDELKKEEKKRSSIHISYSVLIGFMIGTSIYATVKHGLTFVSILPLFFIPMNWFIWKSKKEVSKEIQSRKSN
ncbi:FUSC family protein [Chryseobacterium phosphatilyticum]|uniref:FUSC family protein n=1 Tax=Chryseobacterium phosphatilyticum TaxID=475075 RepID=A0A316XDG0_9FLAO|nr:FUSC family protein [Chryseobacterium phosphatilyticum]PWN71209.1 FUSC family protein [Chryseobacterium phosphatilyticum]